jgi:hypothetical protein
MPTYSHVTVGTSSMNRALRFYDAALAPLGLVRKRTAKIALAYAPQDFRAMREMGATWKIITDKTPEPKGLEPVGIE